MAPQPQWIAVDWGTSNVRAWGMTPEGPVFSAESNKGMGSLSAADYPGVLNDLLAPHMPEAMEGLPVLVCGMAGARQGWREAAYLATPVDLPSLGAMAVHPNAGDLPYSVSILSGVCQREPEDVMRGEETQLLGLCLLRPGFSGLVCMPGTHSKWARLEGTILHGFTTAMTGELFDVLCNHSVLRHSLSGETMGPETENGIDAGLNAGMAAPERLTSLLFRTRAASLLSDMGADWCWGYLSGALVGAEVGARREMVHGRSIPVIGSARLTRLYGEALKRAGATPDPIEATEATLAGLSAAREQLQ